MVWVVAVVAAGSLTLRGQVATPAPVDATSQAASEQAAAAQGDDTPAWMRTLARRHADLIEMNGAGTDVDLQARLLAMREEDQGVRGGLKGAPVTVPEIAKADRRLTVELKDIVAANGWPTIALVGIEASNAAMLVLTHTSDHAWQRSLLPQLEELARAGKIDGSALAVVVDKELVAEGKLQRYGSQFKVQDGAMAMFAVEDPAGLEERRELNLLPPMEAYKQQLSNLYHLQVSAMIVRASVPASKPAVPVEKVAPVKKAATSKQRLAVVARKPAAAAKRLPAKAPLAGTKKGTTKKTPSGRD